MCSQVEEEWRDSTGKWQDDKLAYLLKKAAEEPKVDSHLSPSFIDRWYDVSCCCSAA